MKHLTDEQIVEASDGELSSAGAEHVATCTECAARVAELHAMVARIEEAEVPEPSPLFWQQFAARVTEAVNEAPPARKAKWLSPWALGWTAAAILVVASIVDFGSVWKRGASRTVPAPLISVPGESAAQAPASDPLTGDIETDEAWALVRSLAEDLHYDDAHEAGVSPVPGAVEHVVTELSDDERAELKRLIENELKASGASSE